MFKKSRIKIVASIMSALFILLIGTLGIIFFTSYREVYKQNQTMLKRYIYADFKEDNSNDRPVKKRNDTENTILHSTFYSVSIGKDGQILNVDNNDNDVFSDEEIIEIANSLIDEGKTHGKISSVIYRVEEFEEYTLVAFMDNTLVSQSITTFFKYTLIFGGLSIICIFFISICLSKHIIWPLEKSYEMQKQFISDASHELKTPVSVVSTNAELLAMEIGENQWLTNIQFENNRMTFLVRQLMELVKTENIKPDMEQIDFSRIVEGELLTFESMVYEKELELSYEAILPGVMLYGNREQLGQLVAILMDNAIEHSNVHGKITAELSVNHKRALLSISNEGEPIPEEYRSLIFERFYRTDYARNSDDNHYGLGLAIAKSIVETHHGEIFVSCPKGRVKFFVSLPVKKIKGFQ